MSEANRIDYATNSDGDTGRFKMLAEWEHDCEEPVVEKPTPEWLQFSDAERLEVEMENAEWLREQRK